MRHSGHFTLLVFITLAIAAGVLGWLLGSAAIGIAAGTTAFGAWMVAFAYRVAPLLPSEKAKRARKLELYWSQESYRALKHERARKKKIFQRLKIFRAALMATPDGTILLDAKRRILWCNPAAERMLKLSTRRDRRQLIDDFLPHAPIKAWLAGAHPREPLANVPAPHDESVRLSLRLMPFGEGHYALIARDDTRTVHLEQTRQDFIANASHELRTPLTVLQGYLDLIEPDEMNAPQAVLTELRAQSKRMAQIVESLLSLSRLEAQAQIPEETIDIPQMLSSLAKEAKMLGKGEHDVVVALHAHCGVRGSAQHLHSAFSNLVANAVRYTPPGGKIEISWQTERGHGLFQVKDSGCGIAQEHIPRITERFYRVSANRSRETGGSGLGLAIVKHILHMHQARLAIESEIGRGSEFTCVFDPSRMVKMENGANQSPARAAGKG